MSKSIYFSFQIIIRHPTMFKIDKVYISGVERFVYGDIGPTGLEKHMRTTSEKMSNRMRRIFLACGVQIWSVVLATLPSNSYILYRKC